MAAFFLGAEKAARSKGPSKKTLPVLLDEIYQDRKLSMAPHWDDGNKIRDGILRRAPDEGWSPQPFTRVFLKVFQLSNIPHNGLSANTNWNVKPQR
jgi:hypothetical protein